MAQLRFSLSVLSAAAQLIIQRQRQTDKYKNKQTNTKTDRRTNTKTKKTNGSDAILFVCFSCLKLHSIMFRDENSYTNGSKLTLFIGFYFIHLWNKQVGHSVSADLFIGFYVFMQIWYFTIEIIITEVIIIGFGLVGVKLNVRWYSYIPAVIGNNHKNAKWTISDLFYFIVLHCTVLYCIVNLIWRSGHIVQIWGRKSFWLQKFSEIIWVNFKIDLCSPRPNINRIVLCLHSEGRNPLVFAPDMFLHWLVQYIEYWRERGERKTTN